MISLVLVPVMAASLAACGSLDSGASADFTETPQTAVEEAPAAEEASAEPGEAFTEKTIPVVRDSLESTDTAAVRYYEDLPGVPYMSVTDFYNQFYLVNTELDEGMTFEREDSRYTVTNFCDDAAVFDAAADTIVIDNMTHFIKLACDLQSEDTRRHGSGLPLRNDYP